MDIVPLSDEERGKILPYILHGPLEQGLDGAEVYSGMNQMMVRHAAVAIRRFDFVVSPVAPCVAYPAELVFADPQPGGALRAYRLYGRLQHVGPACGLRLCRLHGGGLPIGPPDHRPPLRRRGRAASRPGLEESAWTSGPAPKL